MTDFLEVEVRAVVSDPKSQSPVVLLQPTDGNGLLLIWVGSFEGKAIAMATKGVSASRPMTHDLLTSMIEVAEKKVRSIRIHSLEENIYFASIILESSSSDRVTEIDARPSDAMVVALRNKTPIEVSRAVYEQSKVKVQSVDEALRTLLETINEEDLGDYQM